MDPTPESVPTSEGARLFVQTLGDRGRCVIVPNGFYLLDDLEPLADRHCLVSYDARNRGRSDTMADESALARGIHNDVEDLEAVRHHLGAETVDVIGHSFNGLTAILYGLKYGARVGRIVLLAAMGPYPYKAYPPELSNSDAVFHKVFADLGELRGQRSSYDPEPYCRAVWSVLRPLYVTDPVHASRIRWDRCDLPNERNFMRYWLERMLPSIQALTLSAEDLARVTVPVLCIHGRKDRSAPYGGARDWATLLPSARLLTLDEAGHAPWVEAPHAVMDALRTFLAGEWPATASSG